MKNWRAAVGLCLILAVIGSLLIPAAADSISTLTVASQAAARGEQVTLDISYQGDAIAGAELELQYDPTALKPIAASAGEAVIKIGGIFAVNLKYTANSINLQMGSTEIMESGVLFRVTFELLASAPLEDSAVTPVTALFYNEQAQPVTVQVTPGAVRPKWSGVSVSSDQAVAGQAVTLDLSLLGEHTPAGGEFVICYDTARLTGGSVAATSLLSGRYLFSREDTPGRIKVVWGGSVPLEEKGVFATVALGVKPDTFGQAEVWIEELYAYDETGTELDTKTQAGAITIVEPEEGSPKLWVVGGSVDDNGSAQVGIVIEDRGIVCGGQFTLTYPTDGCTLKAVTVAEGLTAECNRETPGQLIFNWANFQPENLSQRLITLEFTGVDLASVSNDGALTLSAAESYKLDGTSAGVVDVRSGKLLSGTLAVQTPIVDKAVIDASGANTEVELKLDVANASVFKEGSTVEGGQLILGLYEDGRMKTVELTDDDVQLAFDPNGIAQVQIKAACAGSADTARLFVLSSDGRLVPIAECGNYELAELSK